MSHRFQIQQRQRLHDGYLKVDRFRLRHGLYEGGYSETVQRECMLRGHAVAVLPYDPVADCVLLVEQFRIGALEDERGAWILETIAGMAEPGEAPQTVARRESEEEAGIQLGELELIADYLPSPGCSDERVRLYCGVFDSQDAGGVFGLDEEQEDIHALVLPLDEALDMADDRVIRSAMPLIGLQWLARHRRRLRERWRDADWREALWAATASDPDDDSGRIR